MSIRLIYKDDDDDQDEETPTVCLGVSVSLGYVTHPSCS